MNQTFLSRADLLHCVGPNQSWPGAATLFQARLCGFEKTPELPVETATSIRPTEPEITPDYGARSAVERLEAPPPDKQPAERATFWLAVAVEVIPSEEVEKLYEIPEEFKGLKPFARDRFTWTDRPIGGQPLLPWSKVWPFLRNALGKRRLSRQPDIPGLVKRLVSGKPIARFPRKERLGWHGQAHVLVDRRISLAACWDDYDYLLEHLKRLRGLTGLKVVQLEPNPAGSISSTGLLERSLIHKHGRSRPYAYPQGDAAVLLLGDLGQLRDDAGATQLWRSLGLGFRRRRIVPWALVPCPRDRWSPELARLWRLASWDRGKLLPRIPAGQSALPLPPEQLAAQRAARMAALRTLVSPAVRVERGLLRDLRLLVPAAEMDIGTEIDLWESDGAYGAILGFSLHPKALLEGRSRLKELDPEKLQSVVRLLNRHHADSREVLGWIEILGLRDFLSEDQWQALVKEGLVARTGLEEAHQFFRQLTLTLAKRLSDHDPDWVKGLASWGDRDLQRLGGSIKAVEFQSIWALARRVLADSNANDPIPDFVDKEKIAWIDQLAQVEKPYSVGYVFRKGAVGIEVHHRGANPGVRYPLCHPRSREPVVWNYLFDDRGVPMEKRLLTFGEDEELRWEWEQRPHRIMLVTDRERYDLRSVQRPKWAERMAYDGFGLYAELEVKGVPFRLRWIPPGRFRMGSPKKERGRRDNEGPVHEVTISKGYWLADTPCTQAQWESVMGENPSRFRGSTRPVEYITWHQCVEFCERLREPTPTLNFRLPTEAEWEYACRAGTESAFNDGSDCTDPGGKDPALDRLGWFDENSNHDTHPVREKTPNGWGLYDMHGNVWEWCLDGRRTYKNTETDPLGPTDDSARRALRGGSFWDNAWYRRASCRDGYDPGSRYRHVGFRLASGQPPGSGAIQSRSEGRAEAGSEGRRPVAKFFGIGLDFGESSAFAIIRPNWARHFGRDRFGHFSTFEVKNLAFRLRWIEPGSFLMGSPDDERGRNEDEGPQHQVTISRGFWLGETPCTQEQWEAVMGGNPSQHKRLKNPVDSVTWHECFEFCARLNERWPELELRLPTEAEWEYACRAGTKTAFSDGSDCTNPTGDDPALDRLGWYYRNSGTKTHPVGEKQPNAWGLYDLHGNVWEWCLDGRRNYNETPESDPLGPTDESARRTLRGGSMWLDAKSCRATVRLENDLDFRDFSMGFRFASGQPRGGGANKSRSEGRA
jgi:formylglycine-generating enzyme required for sulfatase activity